MNPATGAQSLVTQGGQLCYPFGIAVRAERLAARHGLRRLQRRHHRHQLHLRLRRADQVDPVTQTQSILSRNAAQWGNLFRNPLGVTVEPGGRILIVNQNGGTGLVAVDPDTGVQDAETTNTGPTGWCSRSARRSRRTAT